MTDAETLNYVQASAAALGLPLAPERTRRVARHWAYMQQLAQPLLDIPLAPHDEPAQSYEPAPFLFLSAMRSPP